MFHTYEIYVLVNTAIKNLVFEASPIKCNPIFEFKNCQVPTPSIGVS